MTPNYLKSILHPTSNSKLHLLLSIPSESIENGYVHTSLAENAEILCGSDNPDRFAYKVVGNLARLHLDSQEAFTPMDSIRIERGLSRGEWVTIGDTRLIAVTLSPKPTEAPTNESSISNHFNSQISLSMFKDSLDICYRKSTFVSQATLALMTPEEIQPNEVGIDEGLYSYDIELFFRPTIDRTFSNTLGYSESFNEDSGEHVTTYKLQCMTGVVI